MSQLGAVLRQLEQERDRLASEMRQIEQAIKSLARVSGGERKSGVRPLRVRRSMSAAARKKIAAAQKARWAKFRAGKAKPKAA